MEHKHQAEARSELNKTTLDDLLKAARQQQDGEDTEAA